MGSHTFDKVTLLHKEETTTFQEKKNNVTNN